MKRTTLFVLVAACFLVACEKDATIDTPEQLTYTMFYNGSIDFYGVTNMLLINNSDTQTITYNGHNDQPLGAFNYAHYSKMHPGTYLVSFTDTAAVPNKITQEPYRFDA